MLWGLDFSVYPNAKTTIMILRSENLVKKYGQRTVVKKVSINVNQGEIVGLLGPNGAGKTSIISCIVLLVLPLLSPRCLWVSASSATSRASSGAFSCKA